MQSPVTGVDFLEEENHHKKVLCANLQCYVKVPIRKMLQERFSEFQYLTRVSPCVKVTKSMMAGGQNKTKHTS